MYRTKYATKFSAGKLQLINSTRAVPRDAIVLQVKRHHSRRRKRLTNHDVTSRVLVTELQKKFFQSSYEAAAVTDDVHIVAAANNNIGFITLAPSTVIQSGNRQALLGGCIGSSPGHEIGLASGHLFKDNQHNCVYSQNTEDQLQHGIGTCENSFVEILNGTTPITKEIALGKFRNGCNEDMFITADLALLKFYHCICRVITL